MRLFHPWIYVASGWALLITACHGRPQEIVVVTPALPTQRIPANPVPSSAVTRAVAVASPAPEPTATIALPRVATGRAMFQMGPQHTGRSSHAGPRQLLLLRMFDTVAPEFSLSDPSVPNVDLQGSAAVAPDGTIYIGNLPGNLFALRDPGSGSSLEVAWRFHPAGASSLHATPAVGPDGTVYMGFSTDATTPEARGTFYALRAPSRGTDAQIVWSVDLGAERQTSSPTLGPDGTLYVTSGAGKVFAIASDGTLKWTFQTGPSVVAAPALGSDGTVYVASLDGKLYAITPPAGSDAREGVLRWTFNFGEHLGGTPLVTASPPPNGANAIGSGASPTIAPDGMIYIGANNSNFYAITPDGKLQWLYEAEREIAGIWSTAAISADASTLFFGANKGGIYALNRRDGSLRWRFDIASSVFSSPTLDSQGLLYIGSHIGHVFALDSSSGQAIADFEAGTPIWTSPAIRPDGSLVVGGSNGHVLLLGAR